MNINDSLVINFWKNAEEQILQIEKEILLPQIEDKHRFLKDYKQALHEFLDIFESFSFTKKRNDRIHVAIDENESLASMIFRKYSSWNSKDENYDVNISEEIWAVKSYIDNLESLSAVLPIKNEFLNLFSASDSNENFITECNARLSLSRMDIQYILSLSLSEIMNMNQQKTEYEIDKYSAISKFLDRLIYEFWEKQVVDENAEITYYYDSKKKNWEKFSKTEFEPSFKEYFWDKQNEKWQLEENYAIV